VIAVFRHGCVNLHPSLLPDLRGAAPVNWALIRGYERTGISTFLIEKRVDAGGILLQQEVDIHPEEDAGQLSQRLMRVGADLIVDTLDGLASGDLKPVSQRGRVSRAPKIYPEMGRIDWNLPAIDLHNLCRGLSPRPGVFAELDGVKVKLFNTSVSSGETDDPPGTFLGTGETCLRMQTGEGVLEVSELQREGKRRLTAEDFIRGYRLDAGTRFG